MQRLILTLLCYLLFVGGTKAEAAYPCTLNYFDMGFGYRQDQLHWKTENGQFKDAWNNINIGQLLIKGQILGWDHIAVKLNLDYGWVCGAQNKSFAENMTANNGNGKGHVWDGLAGIGYVFYFGSCFHIVPFAGYSCHEQDLHIKGEQKMNERVNFFDNLSNKYRARWMGPWLGLDASLNLGCWRIFAEGEFHWACLDAKGRRQVSPCRDESDGRFKDKFNQHSNGYGTVGTLGITYYTCPCWSIGLLGTYQGWHTRNGRERRKREFERRDSDSSSRRHHSSSDESRCRLRSLDLNPIHWRSWAASVIIETTF